MTAQHSKFGLCNFTRNRATPTARYNTMFTVLPTKAETVSNKTAFGTGHWHYQRISCFVHAWDLQCPFGPLSSNFAWHVV